MMAGKSPNSEIISLSIALLNCNPAVAGGMILKCNMIRQLSAADRQKSSPGCGGRLHGKPCGDRTVLTAVLLSVPGRMNLNGATEGMLASDRAERRDEKPPFLQKSAENNFSVSHSQSRLRMALRGRSALQISVLHAYSFAHFRPAVSSMGTQFVLPLLIQCRAKQIVLPHVIATGHCHRSFP